MSRTDLWPGQIDEAYLDLNQVRALASVVRSEVYWAFQTAEPLSTGDVARLLRRAAPTVRYHVNELLKVDLLLAVETRKRRSRIEDAYVHRIARAFTPRPPYDEEYLAEMNRGFAAILRAMERERASALTAANEDPPFYEHTFFRQTVIRIAPDRLRELRQELADLVTRYGKVRDEDGTLVRVAAYMDPLIGESERHFRTITGRELREPENTPRE
ncbi:MAG TPA: helix-turn-helix domain-containing protein [Fimbriimonadaceae bacterium]|nr:helix-turn-helix domain-containing protein [Fimbriimonadaceae bacterium]